MIRSLYSARTGMVAQELQLDTLSNNLANVNTAGFKKSRAQFEDIFYQELRAVGADTAGGGQIPTGIQVGMGVRPTSVQKIFTQGDFVDTGNEFDFAISGRGFFRVIRDGDEYYTRSGAFTKNSDGEIVTQNGELLDPPITIPGENAVTFTIDNQGAWSVKDSNQDIVASGQLNLYDFVNPAGLRAEGGNLFQPTEASGEPFEGDPGTDGLGTIAQRYIEASNVDVTEELVNLIITQRAYESNSKAIQTADRLLEIANTLVR